MSSSKIEDIWPDAAHASVIRYHASAIHKFLSTKDNLINEISDIVKHTLAVEKINITETATKEIQSNLIKRN